MYVQDEPLSLSLQQLCFSALIVCTANGNFIIKSLADMHTLAVESIFWINLI